MLHEYSHLVRHIDHLEPWKNAFIDDIEFSDGNELEEEADGLARKPLIPDDCSGEDFWNEFTSIEGICEVAGASGAAVLIAAGRWQRDLSNFRKFSRLIERKIVRDQLETLMS